MSLGWGDKEDFRYESEVFSQEAVRETNKANHKAQQEAHVTEFKREGRTGLQVDSANSWARQEAIEHARLRSERLPGVQVTVWVRYDAANGWGQCPATYLVREDTDPRPQGDVAMLEIFQDGRPGVGRGA